MDWVEDNSFDRGTPALFNYRSCIYVSVNFMVSASPYVNSDPLISGSFSFPLFSHRNDNHTTARFQAKLSQIKW
jgi:hypothetical protein